MWICTTLWVGFGLMIIGMANRLPWGADRVKFYEDNCNWILNAPSKHDKVVRLAVWNKCIMDIKNTDKGIGWQMDSHYDMHNYLILQEADHYKNLTLAGIKKSCESYEYRKKSYQTARDHRFWSNVIERYYAQVLEDFKWTLKDYPYPKYYIAVGTLYFLAIVAGPFYVLSRLFNVVFPLIVVLYLYIDGGIVLFIDVNLFQSIMWLIYVVLMIVWWILAYPVMRDEYYLWWLMPHRKYLRAASKHNAIPASKMTEMILEKYETVMVLPLIEKLLMEKFGHDIGRVVLDYFSSINLDSVQYHV